MLIFKITYLTIVFISAYTYYVPKYNHSYRDEYEYMFDWFKKIVFAGLLWPLYLVYKFFKMINR